jgi:hypothetical protein
LVASETAIHRRDEVGQKFIDKRAKLARANFAH